MFNRLLLFFFLLLPLHLAAEQVELYATSIENDDNRTLARGDTYLVRDDATIKADILDYDKLNRTIEAYGNIFVNRPGFSYTLTDYLFMDLDKKYTVLDKFFYMSHKEKVWVSSQEAKKEQGIYALKHARLSSCNPEAPDWTIGFSSGDFNEKEEWINLYNPIIYAGRVPVFYLPYLGVPTSTKRRSGLLRLTFGTSNKEGYIFKQPVYLAPHMWWDATWTPEVRSLRGTGNMLELRIADSPYSQGTVEAGKFNDYERYFKEEELQNNEHSGVHVNYERSRLFAGGNGRGRDALYLDYVNVTDVDYLSLQDKTATQIIPSKLNYLYYTPSHYLGMNAKYFIDTTKPSNDNTIQILPQTQYHATADSLFFDNLLYSVDYIFKNYSRDTGLTGKEHAVTVPLSYSFSLFDDYVNLLLSNTLYTYRIDYTNQDNDIISGYEESGQIQKDNLYVSLFTDLGRGYETFFHNMNFSLAYTKVSAYEATGYFHREFVTPTEDQDSVELKFSQYMLDGANAFLSHRVGQSFVIYDEDNVTTSDIENELNLKIWGGFSLDSLTTLSHEYGVIAKATHTIGYSKPDFSLTLNNIFEKNPQTDELKTNYYTYAAMYRPVLKHTFKATYEYDTIFDTSTGYGVEYLLNKTCWDFSISYNRAIKPYLSNDTVNSKINDIIYLRINLNPFWGFEQKAYEYERDG